MFDQAVFSTFITLGDGADQNCKHVYFTTTNNNSNLDPGR